MKAILHIGLPKTATTMLQKGLQNHCREVVNIGKPVAGYQIWRDFSSRSSDRRIRAEKELKTKIRHSFDLKKDLVISDETLSMIGSTGPVEELVNFLRKMGVEVKILFSIREQLSIVVAMYNSSAASKIGVFGVPYLYQKKFNNIEWKGSFTRWIDELVESYNCGEENWLCLLDYAKQAKWIHGLVGKKNTVFLPYEWLKYDRHKWAVTVAKVFGDSYKRVEIWSSEKINVSGARVDDIILLGRLIRALKRRMVNQFVRKLISREMQTKIEKKIGNHRVGHKATVDMISKEKHKELREIYSKSNHNFANLSGLDIESLGYMMSK